MLESVLPWALVAILGYLSGKVLNLFIGKRKESKVPGVPVLGNAVALGRYGTVYLESCRKQFGDVFSLSLVGQQMMFWFEPQLISQLFNATEAQITFRPAVEQFTQRVFGLPSQIFFPKHSQLLQELRSLLVPANLANHAAALSVALDRRIHRLLPTGRKVDLYLAVRRLAFGAGVEVLFGQKCLQQTFFDEAHSGQAAADHNTPALSSDSPCWEAETQLEQVFYNFEAGFEMAASPVPHVFQPGFCSSRDKLITWLGQCHSRGFMEGSVAGELINKCDLPPDLTANALLAVLWASQANTVAATFWSLAFLLLPQHEQHKQNVLDELRQLTSPCNTSATPAASFVTAADTFQGASQMSSTFHEEADSHDINAARSAHAANMSKKAQVQSHVDSHQHNESQAAGASVVAAAAIRAMDRKSAASCCVAEAIRMRVQSIGVRIAASNFDIKTREGQQVRVQKGCILAICPYLTHQDERLYGNALDYNPSRAAMTLENPGNIVTSQAGLAFGAGFYRCPGRFFAEMEVALITQLVLSTRNITLCAPGQAAGHQDTSAHQEAVNTGGDDSQGNAAPSIVDDVILKMLLPHLTSVGSILAKFVFGRQAAKWGLGIGLEHVAGPGSDARQGVHDDEGIDHLWYSGDEDRRLPRPDLSRLVGIKVPKTPCWVEISKNEL